jgi:hypothetical protein
MLNLSTAGWGNAAMKETVGPFSSANGGGEVA